MTAFQALNIEPEEEDAAEVDDTREIQLEEALKLYQNALRLHSLGPEYFVQAAAAYKELLNSEIFRYPEAVSEFTRNELDNSIEETPITDYVLSQLSTIQPADAQASPSSLPQIIYLSFKNYGQFLLDQHAHANPARRPANDWRNTRPRHGLIVECANALKQFAAALERDDTDLDLWRKAARVARVCLSDRIVRYCLESVLAGDDEGANEEVEILGLDEVLAAGQLREVVESIQDDLSIAQSSGNQPKKDLFKVLKETIDPFPFLPPSSYTSAILFPECQPLGHQPKRWVMRATTCSWHGVGQTLLQGLTDEQQFNSDPGLGAALYIDVPDEHDSREVKGGVDAPNKPAAKSNLNNAATVLGSHMDLNVTDNALHTSIGCDDWVVNATKAGMVEVKPSADTYLDAARSPALAEEPPRTFDDACTSERLDDEGAESYITSRKRSAGSAGHDEPPENGRLKSKRLRNREPNADAVLQEETASSNMARYYEDQLRELALADQRLFENEASLLSKLGIGELGSQQDLQQQDLHQHVLCDSAVDGVSASGPPPNGRSMNDLRSALMSWSDEKANAVMYGYGGNTFGGEEAGLTLFLEHSKPVVSKSNSIFLFAENKGLSEFIDRCNTGCYSIHQVAFDWLETIIRPIVLSDSTSTGVGLEPSSYKNSLWPEELKFTVVQLIVRADEYVYNIMQQRWDKLSERILLADRASTVTYTLQDVADADVAQTLYELHLDIYFKITNPSSQVDLATRSLQHDRLQRWSYLAGSFINVYADHANDVPVQQWHVIRFIWTATTHARMTDNISQEHITLCLQDLCKLIVDAGKPTVLLPNNAALPEISLSAVEQEISRISTLDFFTSIFNDDCSPPISIIESLEPILEPCKQPIILKHVAGEDSESLISTSAQTQQLIDFLESGDASLKLFLWRRLRNAYVAIDYPPKVVSCYLRSIEVILSEISSQRHIHLPAQTREVALLRWIKELDDIITRLLHKILADSKAFEIVDERHLQASTSKVARLCRILHSVALYEDAVRVGQVPEPRGKNAASSKSLDKFRDKLRDLHVKVWTLLYTLFREGIAQNKDQFNSPPDVQAEYLQSLHNALGLRGYCKHANKMFLRLLKSELMAMDTKEDYSSELAQVLFDLHQLKFAPGTGDKNHECPPELLDKKSAAHLLETVVLQARRMSVKDLLRSELKGTMDKIQHALGAPKSSPLLSHNRRTINTYLKSPINQLQLFRASRGETALSIRTVDSESAKIAAHGWYFLLGHLALAKFKSFKRTNPGPTDDLDLAVTFFKQDLDHNVEKWETWFRLAQVYDAKIEEELLWTAEKLNNHRAELVALQRNSIHCYELAMAMYVQSGDDTTEATNAVSEMYTGFATRLYSSSREPLSMDAFDTKYHPRQFSSSTEQFHLYEAPSTPSMPVFSVWRFSAHLLRCALAVKPRNWMNHYLLGKCLWKMLTNPDPCSRRRVLVEEVLDAFSEAVENLPERKDNRTDHILEPHFKLVSIVHKLVHRNMLTPFQGKQALQATPWARDAHLGEDEDSWEPYVLGILRKIGHADKANWHHRIIARAAHVIYDDPQNYAGALGAKHEFTKQIFTKTMTLQVWKPEYERAGRHFVYTSRYVLFFVGLLNQLNDRSSLDQLLRRIRRRPGDYLNHQHVWEQVATVYVAVLRRLAKVPYGHEEGVFRTMDHDKFLADAGKLEAYAQEPDTSDILLDILRDAIEVKRLNNSLMKGSLIDDLIVDCYASLYQNFVASLSLGEQDKPTPGPETKALPPEVLQEEGNRERMRVGSILTAQADGNAESSGPGSAATMQTTVPPALHNAASSGMPAPTTKPSRPKTVTRREVQRRAEGLIMRQPAPMKTPTFPKHTATSRLSGPVDVSKPSSKEIRSPITTTNTQPNTAGLGLGLLGGSRVADLVREDTEDEVRSGESSRTGSVHDSADDESELSELEEVDNGVADDFLEEEREAGPSRTAKPAVLFPGLVRKSSEDANEEDSSVVISDSESAQSEQAEGMDIDEIVGKAGEQANPDMLNVPAADIVKDQGG